MKKFALTFAGAGFFLSICAQKQFTDVASSAGIDHVFNYGDFHFGGGAAVLDYNNDGYQDVYIVGGVNDDKLYKNNGDGTFTDMRTSAGITRTGSVLTMGVIAGDVDNDGDEDLFITSRCESTDLNEWAPNLLYLNNGDGTFTDITASSGLEGDSAFSTSATFGDYNLDGYIDIYVLNFLGVPVYSILDSATTMGLGPVRPGSANYLYMNNGDNTFTDVASAVNVVDSGCGWAVAFSDYDEDYDVDLLVANDFGSKTKPDNIYRNEYPQDNFADVGAAANFDIGVNAMGVAVGDYNEDGHMDYYVTDLGDNFLFENTSFGTFNKTTGAAGIKDEGWMINSSMHASIGWGANFFDYDNDTYLDLFVCNGALNPMIPQSFIDTFYNPNTMFHHNGDNTFTNVSVSTGLDDPQRGRGSVVFDYDNDGDLDLLVVNQVHYQGYGAGTIPKVRLYKNNESGGNHWVTIELEGDSANRDAIGSRVVVHANSRSFIREIDGGSSHLSHNSKWANFGLGSISTIDSVEIFWPGGHRQVEMNVAVDQKHDFTETYESGTSGIKRLNADQLISVYPNPFAGEININIEHAAHDDVFDLILTDVVGHQVLSHRFNGQNVKVATGNIAGGVYFYRISKEGETLKEGQLIAQ